MVDRDARDGACGGRTKGAGLMRVEGDHGVEEMGWLAAR